MQSYHSSQDEAFELLAQLRMARRTLSETRDKYGLFVDESTYIHGLMMLLPLGGLACIGGAFWTWGAQLGDVRLRGLVAGSLLLVGVLLMSATVFESSQNLRQRVLRNRLKAELAVARELDRDLETTEFQLSQALPDDAESRSH